MRKRGPRNLAWGVPLAGNAAPQMGCMGDQVRGPREIADFVGWEDPSAFSAGPLTPRLVQRANKSVQVPKAAAAGRVAQALVLRQEVDESVAHVVAMGVQQRPALGASLQDVAYRAVRPELRHRAAGPSPP